MRKFLALFALCSMLFACGSQDGGSSTATLKNDTMRISPFDTLIVEFTASIADIDKLAKDTNVITSDDVEWLQEKSEGNKFIFVGKNATPKGTPFFNEDMTDAIEFKNLKNAVSHATLRFSTIRIIDDIDYKNFEESSAKDLTPFFGATKNNIEFAGVLDHKIDASKINFEDYYKLNMRVGDVFKIVIDAKNIDVTKIQLTEPGKGKLDTTFIPEKKNDEFEYTVLRRHFNDTDNLNTEVPFYIRIFDNAGIDDPSNPYTLTVTRQR